MIGNLTSPHHGKRLEALVYLCGENQSTMATKIRVKSKQGVGYHFGLANIKKDISKQYAHALGMDESLFNTFMYGMFSFSDVMTLIEHYKKTAEHWRDIAEHWREVATTNNKAKQ